MWGGSGVWLTNEQLSVIIEVVVAKDVWPSATTEIWTHQACLAVATGSAQLVIAIPAGQNSQEEGAGGAQHEPVGSEPHPVAEKDDVRLDLVVDV